LELIISTKVVGVVEKCMVLVRAHGLMMMTKFYKPIRENMTMESNMEKGNIVGVMVEFLKDNGLKER